MLNKFFEKTFKSKYLKSLFCIFFLVAFLPNISHAQIWPDDLSNPKEILPDPDLNLVIPKALLEARLVSEIGDAISVGDRTFNYTGAPIVKFQSEKNLIDIKIRGVQDSESGFKFSFIRFQIAPEVKFDEDEPYLEMHGQVKNFWALNIPMNPGIWKAIVERANAELEKKPLLSLKVFELFGDSDRATVTRSSVWVGKRSVVVQASYYKPPLSHLIAKITEDSSIVHLPKTKNENSNRLITIDLPEGSALLRSITEFRNEAWPASCILPPNNHWHRCEVGQDWCTIGWVRVGSKIERRRSVSARFYSWSHCNRRKARLRVEYQKTHEVLKNSLTFNFDSIDLSDEVKTHIDRTLEIAGPFSKIILSGHTDSIGSAEYNTTLSFERANMVKNYILTKEITTAEKIEIVALGETQPTFDNTLSNGRTLNRRVHMYFTGK